MVTASNERDQIAARYRRYAAWEARPGRSPLYEAFARGVAGDPATLTWLASLPRAKRQPVLVFAAARAVLGERPDWPSLRDALHGRIGDVTAVVLARRTQLNEPNRCATLLPLLASLPGPLALLEVGASAGLCLYPDRYAYDYGRGRIGDDRAPLLRCRTSGAPPLPARVPGVAWRAGLDLEPIDVRDPAQVRWLELLVAPDEPARLARLRAAIEVARADPPRIVRGDLASDLSALAAEAPRDATLVVYHSGVLGYVPPDGRSMFVDAVRQLGATWISAEMPGTFPEIDARLASPPLRGKLLLSRDGSPYAWAGMYGETLEWFGA